jgi:antirestriction protein ArdC
MQRSDLYARVTDRIVANLENGVRPWMKPWNVGSATSPMGRPLRHNGIPYSGINVVTLWMAATARGYICPTWLTYRQAVELGAHVRRGETGETVVYASTMTRTETTNGGEEVDREARFLKCYIVFNAEQIDGLPKEPSKVQHASPSQFERVASAETFFANTQATIRFGGQRAYYDATSDHIQMPLFENFRDPVAFYATLAHESAHWTSHKKRLDRDLGRRRWGDAGYAAEELVAELGSAFLCADLGLALEPRPDHAGYIKTWLKVLADDNRAIFRAAADAERATGYLHALQPAVAPSVPDTSA